MAESTEIQDTQPTGPEWTDMGSCWLHAADQNSDSYRIARSGKITGCIASRVAGNTYYCSDDAPKYISYQIKGQLHKTYTPESTKRIEYGKNTEDKVRKWYEKNFGTLVRQVGFAVWKQNPKIGVSVDGLVGEDGIIEIKTTLDGLYSPLITACKNPATSDPLRCHIKRDHYDQMQHGMLVYERKWCDYIVYSNLTKEIYHERVPYNSDYVENVLLPKYTEFIEKYDI